MNDLLKAIVTSNLDNSYLFDIEDDLVVSKAKDVRWSIYNKPPCNFKQASIEYNIGAYPIALYIYVAMLTEKTKLSQLQVQQINSLLDPQLDLTNVTDCLNGLLEIMDRLHRNNFYEKGLYLMGIAQSLNNIVTSDFNPKAISKYPTYIRLQKLILKYFKLSVTILIGCNLELEFDTVNALNYNLAMIEINYGIILISPDINAIPSCKGYKIAGEKTLRMCLARLTILFQRDPDKKYLLSISKVFDLLNQSDKAKEVYNTALKLDDTSTDLSNISLVAQKKRQRSYKHLIEIYTS